MRINHILKEHAYQNIPLTYQEAYKLGVYMWSNCFCWDPSVSDEDTTSLSQCVTALSALHNQATYAWRGNQHESPHGDHPVSASEQIAGICAPIFKYDIDDKYLRPNVPYVMDNSGMGGDLIVTANVSTIAAFIASAAGIPMVKHGSPANADQGRHGSSDFIKLCGISTTLTPEVVEYLGKKFGADFGDSKKALEACIEQLGFGYIDALDTRFKCIHRQTHLFARLAHMNDIIGPITNPVDPKLLTRRVLGVNHIIPPRVVAEAYLVLNTVGITAMEHAIIVRGFGDNLDNNEGMDELSICEGGTIVATLNNGYIREYRLGAYDFGLKPVRAKDISPPKGMSKGEFSLGILKGEIGGPPLQMVLANAALLFYLDRRSSDLKVCYAMAKEVHESGKAYQKMLAVREMLPGPKRDVSLIPPGSVF